MAGQENLTLQQRPKLLSKYAPEAVCTTEAARSISQNLRTWVAERAAEGDARAAAQLRGWRYAEPAESAAARCKAGSERDGTSATARS